MYVWVGGCVCACARAFNTIMQRTYKTAEIKMFAIQIKRKPDIEYTATKGSNSALFRFHSAVGASSFPLAYDSASLRHRIMNFPDHDD
jgi:hypothetical protein